MRDIATPATQFASLQIPVQHVFVTENEVNGLAFPDAAESIVVFGLGYGVDLLASIPWLKRCEVHYWGDIDTHGFAMLDRLRAACPAARSMLMDREILFFHRALWVHEPSPFRGVLTRLCPSEQKLFTALAQNEFGKGVRLEQERISFRHVQLAVREIAGRSRDR
jgi:hypothetical protein